MKVSEILKDALSVKALEAHISTYFADVTDALETADFTLLKTGVVYQSTLNAFGFLKHATILYLLQSGKDFLFCFTAATEDKQAFSGYFSNIISFSPWGVPTEDPPDPDLAAIEVDDIKWLYVYVSSTANAEILWQTFTTNIDLKNILPADIPNNFKSISGIAKEDKPMDDTLTGHGGLYYFGTLNSFLPQLIQDATGWDIMSAALSVKGALYFNGILSFIKLQLSLAAITNPLDNNSSIELISEFSASLTGSQEFLPLLLGDFSSATDLQKKNIKLIGSIIADNQSLDLSGSWPLDDDVIEISINCSLNDINKYFNPSDFIPGLSFPDTLDSAAAFEISKQTKSLRTLSFDLTVADWILIDGIFSIASAAFSCTVHDPGTINITTALFTGKAIIGKPGGNGIQLLCSGSYPDGNFSLALDPLTPIHLKPLINVFCDTDLGFADDLAITEFSGAFNLTTRYIAFKLSIGNTNWSTGDLGFSLKDVSFGIFGADKYSFRLSGDFTYAFRNGHHALFTGSAAYDSGWQFSLSYQGNITLADIAGELFGFKDILPGDLESFGFDALNFAYDGTNHQRFFSGTGNITLFDEALPLALLVNNTPEATNYTGSFQYTINNNSELFNLTYIKSAAGYNMQLQLLFTIAGITIQLDAVSQTTNSQNDNNSGEKLSEKHFIGNANNLQVSLSNLLESLLQKLSINLNIPQEYKPDIILTDIHISCNGKNHQTDVIALTVIDGKETKLLFQYKTATDTTPCIYAFGILADFGGLGSLPLVGNELENIELKEAGFIYTSQAGNFILPVLTSADASNNRQITDEPKAKSLTQGFNIVGKINLPVEPIDLLLPGPKEDDVPPSNQPASTTFDDTAAETNVTKDTNTKLGPITLTGFALGYKEKNLTLQLNGTVVLGGLTMSVEGLQLSFNLQALISSNLDGLKPEFGLSGLGLDFEKDPLIISGMFLRAAPAANELFSFYGAAELTTSKFSITAVGAYAYTTSHQSSLFVYGVYLGPIGGPAVFFVTGIAAGFGYNRKIRIPQLEEVQNFPLVSIAMNGDGSKTLPDVLESLANDNWIPDSPGDYWLAVGIKFTSFKLIESFVLLTAAFGTGIEFCIIGLSLLKWPAEDTPIAYVEMAVLATFGSESDLISVEGMLTHNSYILDKNCTLTGGFAFYTWVSGEHEGDFVITLGGYHPAYTIPAHYPQVDRLGLQWNISDELSVRGEMYFALTPREIMAGGRWEIVYSLSFLSVSITLWANMIIQWAPFHYEMDAGIIIKIEADIKILFVHIHFSVQMGCELHIYGPPFGGYVYVDWSIFSFTIPFGDSNNAGSEIDLDKFVESFVPKKDGDAHPVDARFINGVTGTGGDDNTKIFVNPFELVIGVESFFPLTTVKPNFSNQQIESNKLSPVAENTLMEVANADIPTTVDKRNLTFGIKPMGENILTTTLIVAITGESVPENINIITSAKGFNAALWYSEKPDPHQPRENDPSPVAPHVITNVLSGLQMHMVENDSNDDVAIPLDENFYTYLSQNIQLDFLHNSNANASEDANAINEILAAWIKDKNIATAKMNSALQDLKDIGFDLQQPDALASYAALSLDTPLYLASIGQALPAIQNI